MRVTLLFCTLAAAAITPSGWAFAPIGHGRLVGTASANLEYDSNIFMANPDAAQLLYATKPASFSDWILSESGDVRYIRDSGLITVNTGVGMVLREFAHNRSQDTADPYFDGRMGYSDSDKTELRGGFTLRRSTIANPAVNARTRSNDAILDGTAQYLPTEKLGFRVLGSYASSHYLTSAYSDTHGYTVGVDAVDIYSPKLKLLAGIAGGENWADPDRTVGRRGVSGVDVRYTVGAEGEIAAKVTANANVGLVQRHFQSGEHSDMATLYSDSRITWEETEKRSWSLEGTQNFDVTALDQSVRALGVFISLNDALAEKLNLQAAVGYERTNYVSLVGSGSRTDHGPAARARLTYNVNDTTTVEISSSYRDNASSSDYYPAAQLADFTRFTFGAGINARF